MTNKKFTEDAIRAKAHELWQLYGIDNRCELFWRMAEAVLEGNTNIALALHIGLSLLQRGYDLCPLRWMEVTSDNIILRVYCGGKTLEYNIDRDTACHEIGAIMVDDMVRITSCHGSRIDAVITMPGPDVDVVNEVDEVLTSMIKTNFLGSHENAV